MPVRSDFVPGEFCWIDLSSHDMNAAVKWYGDLFGWSHTLMETPAGSPPYAFFMKGEAAIAGIGQMNDEMKSQGIPSMWNNYVSTDDCEATEARVRENGGQVTVPTSEIPGHGKLAFFLDPQGASFAAWQSLNPNGPGLLCNEPVGLCWNELMTRDLDGAMKFYGAVAGWDFVQTPMGDINYTMIKNGGKDGGGLMAMDKPEFEGVPSHWMAYFAVGNCEAATKQAQESGGSVHVPPMTIPVGTMSVLADPQGAPFAVIALAQPE